MNCAWAQALTRFDCRPLTGLDGALCLEIGTPFSLPDGSAINLYLQEIGEHVRISDNADTIFQLGGMGLDIWAPISLAHAREIAQGFKLQLSDAGEIFMLARKEHAAAGFAVALTGLIGVSNWASARMDVAEQAVDLAAEAEPYLIARNPSAGLVRHPKVRGASRIEHRFDFRQGNDLIDVIPANAQATGGVMRKVGDVQNGPFAEPAEPLIIVDDRGDRRSRAESELAILAAVTRAMPFSRLISGAGQVH